MGRVLIFIAIFLPAAALIGAADRKMVNHVPVLGGLQGKSCFECHIKGRGITLPSQERPQKYSKSWAYLSYLESPHGRMRTLGDRNQPQCEDCHLTREWSKILPREHPDSPINPANLPRICAKCHGDGMLTANVSKGAMHLELERRPMGGKPLAARYGFLPGVTKLEKSYYIGPIDVVATTHFMLLNLTVLTMVVLAGYIMLDLIRKLIDRYGAKVKRHHAR